jgi:AcrR family transcriptional regulator
MTLIGYHQGVTAVSYVRPLGRAEARARTREVVLEAAEELFMTTGYSATTVAQIAAKAGRTQGAIYGNFANKEALCFEVLKSRYTQTFAQLAAALFSAEDTLDGKLDAIAHWWTVLAGDGQLTILWAEYGLAVHRDPDQRAALRAYLDSMRELLRDLIAQHLPGGDDESNELIDTSVVSILAAGSGLALFQAAGLIDAGQSSGALTENVRLWSDRLKAGAPESE